MKNKMLCKFNIKYLDEINNLHYRLFRPPVKNQLNQVEVSILRDDIDSKYDNLARSPGFEPIEMNFLTMVSIEFRVICSTLKF